MIYTVTCNPALDYVMRVDAFSEGATNRSTGEALSAGGKGINVSMVLRELGQPSVALGFVAGFTGDAIAAALDAAGIAHDFVRLPHGTTRINVKMKREQACGGVLETELNGRGPQVDAAAVDALAAKVAGLDEGDTLILSGSAPAGADASLYRTLAEAAAQRGARTVVDATGDLLLNALPARPFLIKPNNEELAELSGCGPHDREALVAAAAGLAQRGARFVLVSCGGDGAFLADADGLVAQAQAPAGTLVNSVGAGDSMVAGFVAGYEGATAAAAGDGPAASASAPLHDARHALALGVAAGSATAFSLGLATRADIAALRVTVE